VTLLWILVVALVIVIAATTIVDLFRQPSGAWNKAAWLAFILLLPLIGAFTYWMKRKPRPGEAEPAYESQENLPRPGQRLPVDRSGL
jgi:hypothetical protein